MPHVTVDTAQGQRALHRHRLAPGQETVVEFPGASALQVEIVNLDGADEIYLTGDDTPATVGGANTTVVPAAICSANVPVYNPAHGVVVVRLISDGSPLVSAQLS